MNIVSPENRTTGYNTFEGNDNKSPAHQENCVVDENCGRKIALRDFFTVLALSFHSVFEGLAIGLEPTSEDVLLLFAGKIILKQFLGHILGFTLIFHNHSFNQISFYSFLAIASHKYIIAFCVGLELHNANTPLRLYSTYMLIFSLMSPLGVGIGIGITSATSTQSTAYILSVAILQVRTLNSTKEERIKCFSIHEQW